MWKLFQLAVFVGVLFANVYWEWTPNGYLASLLAFAAAYMATALLGRFFGLLRLVLQPRGRRRALQ